MRRPLALAFILLVQTSFGQDIRVFNETLENKAIVIKAENLSESPQSVMVEVEYKGMKSSEPLPITKLIPPKTTLDFLTLTPGTGSYSYNYKFTYILGDVKAVHNDSIIYRLPFIKNEKYTIDQGYNGRTTHKGQFALDFHMNDGTEIYAIRTGVVIKSEDGNKKGCLDQSCAKYNNVVLVQHSDGSIADYSHLQFKGARVKVGDSVNAGDLIGLSGSTGVASGPHLHLEVYVMRWDGQHSVSVKYYLDKNTIGIPQEGKTYQQEL